LIIPRFGIFVTIDAGLIDNESRGEIWSGVSSHHSHAFYKALVVLFIGACGNCAEIGNGIRYLILPSYIVLWLDFWTHLPFVVFAGKNKKKT